MTGDEKQTKNYYIFSWYQPSAVVFKKVFGCFITFVFPFAKFIENLLSGLALEGILFEIFFFLPA